MSTTRAMTPAEAMAAGCSKSGDMDSHGFADGKGGRLEIRGVTFASGGLPVVVTGEQGFAVDPGEIPEITAKLYEAAGSVPPVMLGRPDIPDGASWSPWQDCPLTVAVDGGKVRQMWRDGPSLSMTPAQARQHAAALVVLADRAEAEPDPAEVEALTDVLRETYQRDNHVSFPDHARAILLAGWKREAGHG
jgi:hypothetical protein